MQTDMRTVLATEPENFRPYLRNCLRNETDVDDMVQAMSLAIWEYPPKAMPDNLTAYMIQVANSVLQKRQQQLQAEERIRLSAESDYAIPVLTDDHTRATAILDEITFITDHIYKQQDAPKAVRALELHISGSTDTEIAAELKISAPTVASYISDGKEIYTDKRRELAMRYPREYLNVPFEEYPELARLGAHWDADRMAWYLKPTQDREKFKPWLVYGQNPSSETRYSIESSRANVLIGKTRCWSCGEHIEVIGIYCKRGTVDGEPYVNFTVTNLVSIDIAFKKQLALHKHFRKSRREEVDPGTYANHCHKCGAAQIDSLLHHEPEGPFFNMADAEAGSFTMTPLTGTVRMNGDEGFDP